VSRRPRLGRRPMFNLHARSSPTPAGKQTGSKPDTAASLRGALALESRCVPGVAQPRRSRRGGGAFRAHHRLRARPGRGRAAAGIGLAELVRQTVQKMSDLI